MIDIVDQTGFKLMLKKPAQRIVSLVPSITELLFHLHLDNEVKGITLFCTHPRQWKKTKKIIGGTKKIKHHLIEAIQPDLILANKEENTKEDVEKLKEKYQVYVSDVKNLNDAIEMIDQTGILTGRKKQSHELILTIREKFDALKRKISGMPPMKAMYLIWKNPYMTAGRDTFIHHIMQTAGFSNAFSHYTRYPVITEQQIKESGAAIVLLPSEPFPFKNSHEPEIKKIISTANVILADGTYFSWYGSRLKDAPDYLLELRKRTATIRTFGPQS